MPDRWSIFDFFSKRRQQKALRDEDDKELFVRRYRSFREVLKLNNQVLLTMGDMQEKSSGAFVFDRAYVRSSYEAAAQGIKGIIDHLNFLTDGKYKDLKIPFTKTDEAIRRLLAARMSIPKSGHVLELKALRKENVAAAGGKLAHLGELTNVLTLPVPHGFVITTQAYQTFLEHNRIQDLLGEKIGELDVRQYDRLQTASDEMQELVRRGRIPPELEGEILEAHRAMRKAVGNENLRVAVRSSAIHEDILSSFAGQYETALNVPEEDLLPQYKNVVASQFTPRALYYYRDKGFAVEEMAMAVGVLAMIEARTSGIMYSRDPGSPQDDVVLINAVWGLGAYAVGGIVPTDNYRISGDTVERVTGGEDGCQEVMLVGASGCGTEEVPVPETDFAGRCLGEAVVLRLSAYARKIERHFGQPQDIEWVMDPGGRLYLVQARPLRMPSPVAAKDSIRPRVIKGRRILLDKGTIACRGVGAGPVHVVKGGKDMASFPEGGVLVVRHSHPEYAAVLPKAAAIVSDIGNTLGHLATVAREYNIPAIFGTEKATKILPQGEEVTVDAVYAYVYEGIVEEVLREKETVGPVETSPALKQLREVLAMITPLNLTDPRSASFSPGGCRTLHDITRFAHEVSMRAIFALSKESRFAERSARQLVSGVPLQWWVIDLGDGVASEAGGKKVKPEEILSVPMRALWEGMTALPWKGPPPVDAKGFLSVMFTATTDPALDPAVGSEFADRNYMIVSRNFCNVSTRLGFHFSTIESFAGEEENQNYISFVYTGGGADEGRKKRRVALISRFLEQFDFRVETRGDTVFARIEGHKMPFLEDRLKVLGHIIVHTRQMDMVMYNDAMVDYYYRDIMKGIGSLVRLPE